MTSEKLFKILGNIDEAYVAEAKAERKVLKFGKTGGKKMRKNEVKFFKRPFVAVATLVLFVCVTGVTALAASGKLQGFFKDVKRFDGAVVGTTYEQATDEMTIQILQVSEDILVEVSIVDPTIVPYRELELFGVNRYEIINADGKTIVKGETTEMAAAENGVVTIHIPLEDVPSGQYTLVISEMIGSKKADQPLVMSGTWESAFEVK